MTKQRRVRKTYTREFKQEAVRLMETTDRPASQIAVELGTIQRDTHSVTIQRDTHPENGINHRL